MKLHLFCALVFYNIVLSSTRLVQKTTDKPNERVKDVSSSVKMSGPKIVHFHNGKLRTPRQGENNQTKNSPKQQKTQAEVKPPLVKKPIPKYNEMDSDEYYQLNQVKNRLPSKFFDSIDHEDEDFNLNDYDFDVNHDEFVGRGKPLEPRKEYKQATEVLQSKSVRKTKRNLVGNNEQNSVDQKPLTKRKANYKIKEDDYEDDFPTKIKKAVQQVKTRNANEDPSEESHSSREYPGLVKNGKSPWSISNVEKLGEKSSVIKFLSFLPMFPQVPGKTISGIDSLASNE